MVFDVSGLAVGPVPEGRGVTPEAEVGAVITEDLGKLKPAKREQSKHEHVASLLLGVFM